MLRCEIRRWFLELEWQPIFNWWITLPIFSNVRYWNSRSDSNANWNQAIWATQANHGIIMLIQIISVFLQFFNRQLQMKERILSVCLPSNKKMRIDQGKEVLVTIEKIPRAHEEQQKKKKRRSVKKKFASYHSSLHRTYPCSLFAGSKFGASKTGPVWSKVVWMEFIPFTFSVITPDQLSPKKHWQIFMKASVCLVTHLTHLP